MNIQSIRRLLTGILLYVCTGSGFMLSAIEPIPVKMIVENGIIIPVDPSAEDAFIGYLAVGEDGRLTHVGRGSAPDYLDAETTVDASGKFVAPGFVSAHSHIWTSGMRGVGHEGPLYHWGAALVEICYEGTADDYYWFSLHGAFDFLRNGITTTYDFTYSGTRSKQVEPGEGDAARQIIQPGPYEPNQFKAKVDAGIRFVHSFGMPRVGEFDERRARVAEFVEWARAYPENPYFLKLAISGGVQWAPTKEHAELEVEMMRKHTLDNQPHFLETAVNIAEQRKKFDWYHEAGAFGPSFYFGHFVHPTPEMIKIAADAGTNMIWQATSNGRLASGIADIPAFKKAGMEIGMGLDDQACTDVADPFQNMRIGMYTMRAKYSSADAMSVKDVLYHHTLGGARVLRIDDKVGSLEVGKFADFLIVDPANPDTGPIYDPLGSYVLAMSLRNLKQVYVGGDLVADDGTLTSPLHEQAEAELHKRLHRVRTELGHDMTFTSSKSAIPATHDH